VRPTPVVEPTFAVPSAIPSVVDTADAAEIAVAELLAEVLGVRRVPVGSHFFDDLGACSRSMLYRTLSEPQRGEARGGRAIHLVHRYGWTASTRPTPTNRARCVAALNLALSPRLLPLARERCRLNSGRSPLCREQVPCRRSSRGVSGRPPQFGDLRHDPCTLLLGHRMWHSPGHCTPGGATFVSAGDAGLHGAAAVVHLLYQEGAHHDEFR
jgi:hypothetical protein